MPEIEFTKIVPTQEQIQTLFDLLTQRAHRISHVGLPSFTEHAAFVAENPYRAWYLVAVQNKVVGSFYISNENTVGLNLDEGAIEACLGDVIAFVRETYAPLPAIRSVRAGSFSINVPPTTQTLMGALDHLGKRVLQVSYALND